MRATRRVLENLVVVVLFLFQVFLSLTGVPYSSGHVHIRRHPPRTDANSTKTPDWACIRQKESGDNYRAGGLEPYGGAYQFSVSTWRFLGFKGLPNQASPAVQNRAALKLYRWDLRYTGNPWSAWQTAPLCGLS